MRRLLPILVLALPLKALLTACGDETPVGTESGGSSGESGAGAPGLEQAGRPSEGGGVAVAVGGEGGRDAANGGATSGGSSAGSGPTAGSAGMTGYLPCEAEADCDAFGGGKVCCVLGAMHFCTKPSACPGDTLP